MIRANCDSCEHQVVIDGNKGQIMVCTFFSIVVTKKPEDCVGWVEYKNKRPIINSCPDCGCNELLCGYPKGCSSED